MIKKIAKKWKRYYKISNVEVITRRYFVMNAFDGALTMLGVVIGAYISGVIEKPMVILSAGIAGSIAMGVSGLSGAYMTEKAERAKKLKDLERAMLSDLKGGLHSKSHMFAVIFAAVIDGLSPAFAAAIVISPFFVSCLGLISVQIAFYSSIIITLLILLSLGAYLAKISDESMLRYGLEMLFVGIITVIICVLTSIILGGNIVTF